MGADLIVGVLEMEKGKAPDWGAAKAVIDQAPVEVLEKMSADYFGDFDAEPGTPEWDTEVSEFRKRLMRALDELQCMCEGGHRCAVVRECSGGTILIFGGLSWGDDPFEGYNDICAVADLTWEAAGGRFCA